MNPTEKLEQKELRDKIIDALCFRQTKDYFARKGEIVPTDSQVDNIEALIQSQVASAVYELLLSSTTEPRDLNVKETPSTAKPKRGRPTEIKRDITKTSQSGLREGLTRATFIIREDTLDRLKQRAYDDRKKLKDIVTEALDYYLDKTKTDSQVDNIEALIQSQVASAVNEAEKQLIDWIEKHVIGEDGKVKAFHNDTQEDEPKLFHDLQEYLINKVHSKCI